MRKDESVSESSDEEVGLIEKEWLEFKESVLSGLVNKEGMEDDGFVVTLKHIFWAGAISMYTQMTKMDDAFEGTGENGEEITVEAQKVVRKRMNSISEEVHEYTRGVLLAGLMGEMLETVFHSDHDHEHEQGQEN